MEYRTETHLKLKPCEVVFAYYLPRSCLILFQFCMLHGNDTAVPWAKFPHDWVLKPIVWMHEFSQDLSLRWVLELPINTTHPPPPTTPTTHHHHPTHTHTHHHHHHHHHPPPHLPIQASSPFARPDTIFLIIYWNIFFAFCTVWQLKGHLPSTVLSRWRQRRSVSDQFSTIVAASRARGIGLVCTGVRKVRGNVSEYWHSRVKSQKGRMRR